MTIEVKFSDRAEARRYLNIANIEFVETIDGFEIEEHDLPAAISVLCDRFIVHVVNTGEL